MNNPLYLTVDDQGVPHVTHDPISTPDINVCPDCGCLQPTHPDHHNLFPEESEETYA